MSAFDAFGEQIVIGSDAQGQANVELTDAAGTTFDLKGSMTGATASLSVNVGVGDTSGTKRAELTEDATATSTTGSERARDELAGRDRTRREERRQPGRHAGAHDRCERRVVADEPCRHRRNARHRHARRARASGRDARRRRRHRRPRRRRLPRREGQTERRAASSREAKGGVSLDSAASREIIAVQVSALGDDLRSPSSPQNSMTKDDGTITIKAFGHRTARHEARRYLAGQKPRRRRYARDEILTRPGWHLSAIISWVARCGGQRSARSARATVTRR